MNKTMTWRRVLAASLAAMLAMSLAACSGGTSATKYTMTSMDITSQPEKRIVARQMHKAILDYMNSDQFRPQFTVTPQQISELFTKTAGDIKSYTNDSPDELKPKIN